MTDILITGGVGLLTTIISGWVSWVFARRKYNSEVDNNLIENMQESLDFYKKLSDDNRARLEEVLKRNEDLEDEVRELRSQLFSLMNSICTDLSCQIRRKELTNLNVFKNSYLIIGGPNTKKSEVSRCLSKKLNYKLINLDR